MVYEGNEWVDSVKFWSEYVNQYFLKEHKKFLVNSDSHFMNMFMNDFWVWLIKLDWAIWNEIICPPMTDNLVHYGQNETTLKFELP